MEHLRGLLCPAVHQLVGLSVASVLSFSVVDMALLLSMPFSLSVVIL
jgi:hypothetical protein